MSEAPRQFEIERTDIPTDRRLIEGDVVLASECIDRQIIESTAIELIQNRSEISKQIIVGEQHNNALTGLMEKITAAGHLSVIKFEGDQEQIHLGTIKRLLNGYDETAPNWEKDRRFQELCEELTVYEVFLAVSSGQLPSDTKVITHSDFPDALEASDTEKVSYGYRALNKKGMLRSYHFEKNEKDEWIRVLEQLSRSNSHDLSTRQWFNQYAAAVPLHTTAGLSQQALATGARLPDGVISLAKELDGIYGTDRLYGDPTNNVLEFERPAYEDLRQESAEIEDMLSEIVKELAITEEYLQALRDNNMITYDQHLALFDKKINELQKQIVLLAPQFAEDTYGKEAAKDIYRASIAFWMEDYQQAEMYLDRAEEKKDDSASVGCGGVRADSVKETGPTDSSAQAIEKASERKENWKWKKGICQIKSCPTRPGKTSVGPCSICEKCQTVFNRGSDPTKMKKRQREHEIMNVPESNEVKMYKKKQELLKKTARMAAEKTGVKVVNEQYSAAI